MGRRIVLTVVLSYLTLVMAGCGKATTSASSGAPPSSRSAIAREDTTLDFGGYSSHAELTYPPGGGRHPVVVLIPGSGHEDRDADICGRASSRPLSHDFADIASHLSTRGYAVLRYDKRGVTGPCQGSISYTLPQLLKDASVVLSAAERDPHVDRHRVFVYGWSEGSSVAAALVLAHPEVSGLIVQGGAVPPWSHIFEYQALQVGVPYLRSLAPDGRVDSAVLARAATGGGGLVAKGIVLDVAAPSRPTAAPSPGASPGQFTVNPRLDTNRDGAVEIDTELVPRVHPLVTFLLSPAGPLHTYARGVALPVLSEQAQKLALPTLILQGQNDANVPAAAAATFDRALAARDKTLKVYPGLGHSLGPATSVITDNFAPMATAPLADMTSWLDAHR